jgi:hypothetical protein
MTTSLGDFSWGEETLVDGTMWPMDEVPETSDNTVLQASSKWQNGARVLIR